MMWVADDKPTVTIVGTLLNPYENTGWSIDCLRITSLISMNEASMDLKITSIPCVTMPRFRNRFHPHAPGFTSQKRHSGWPCSNRLFVVG